MHRNDPMHPQKPKRGHGKRSSHNWIRIGLIGLMIAPLGLLFFRRGALDGIASDGIALMVMITAAVYLLHEGIVYALKVYLQGDVPAYPTENSEQHTIEIDLERD